MTLVTQRPRDDRTVRSGSVLKARRPRPSNRGRGNPDYRLLHAVADGARPDVESAFLSYVELVRRRTSLAELSRAVETGSADSVAQALGVTDQQVVHDELYDFLFAVDEVFEDGAIESQAALIREIRATKVSKASLVELGMRFDITNQRTVQFINSYNFDLVRGISQETQRTIQSMVSRSFTEGVPTLSLAREIRETVGLTERQAAAVVNYRRALQTGDVGGAVGRKLSAVDRALARRAGDLTRAQVDDLVSRYAATQLNVRARNIARTETIRAANAGQSALWEQAADEGLIDRQESRRIWVVTPDDVLCPICEPIPQLNQDGVGLSDFFDTPVGPVDYPPVHPSCRCATSLTFRSDSALGPRTDGQQSEFDAQLSDRERLEQRRTARLRRKKERELGMPIGSLKGRESEYGLPVFRTPGASPPAPPKGSVPTGPAPATPSIPPPRPAIPGQDRVKINTALTQEERNAVDFYKENGYRPINDYLRTKGRRGDYTASQMNDLFGEPSSTTQLIRRMDDAFKKGEITDDVVVYRGLPRNALSSKFKRMRVGQGRTERAFTSTSFDREVAEGFSSDGGVIARIRVPRGSRGLYITTDEVTDLAQSELLLPRNVKLVKIGDTVENGRRVIDFRLTESFRRTPAPRGLPRTPVTQPAGGASPVPAPEPLRDVFRVRVSRGVRASLERAARDGLELDVPAPVRNVIRRRVFIHVDHHVDLSKYTRSSGVDARLVVGIARTNGNELRVGTKVMNTARTPDQVRGTMRHEFGHMFDAHTNRRMSNDVQFVELFREEFSAMPSELRRRAKYYMSNPAEHWAESFNLLFANSDSASVLEMSAAEARSYFPRTLARVRRLIEREVGQAI